MQTYCNKKIKGLKPVMLLKSGLRGKEPTATTKLLCLSGDVERLYSPLPHLPFTTVQHGEGTRGLLHLSDFHRDHPVLESTDSYLCWKGSRQRQNLLSSDPFPAGASQESFCIWQHEITAQQRVIYQPRSPEPTVH